MKTPPLSTYLISDGTQDSLRDDLLRVKRGPVSAQQSLPAGEARPAVDLLQALSNPSGPHTRDDPAHSPYAVGRHEK
jgi:hypothetical protein